jgi:hypothetical protein
MPSDLISVEICLTKVPLEDFKIVSMENYSSIPDCQTKVSSDLHTRKIQMYARTVHAKYAFFPHSKKVECVPKKEKCTPKNSKWILENISERKVFDFLNKIISCCLTIKFFGVFFIGFRNETKRNETQEKHNFLKQNETERKINFKLPCSRSDLIILFFSKSPVAIENITSTAHWAQFTFWQPRKSAFHKAATRYNYFFSTSDDFTDFLSNHRNFIEKQVYRA